MAKPVTLLEELSAHVLSFGASAFETERDAGTQRAFAMIEGQRTRVANFSSSMAREFHEGLQKALKKPLRTVIVGSVYEIKVQAVDDRRCLVTVQLAPKLAPGIKPSFTAKQGEYLAFIHHYTKVHKCPPSETDMQRYFHVSAPSVHEMVKTLERNGLIERTPRVARSIRLLVESEYLPKLRSGALWKNSRWAVVHNSSQQERHP